MGQCFQDEYMSMYNICAVLNEDFTLSKSMNIKPSSYTYGGEKLEFKYMFTKSSIYQISLCQKEKQNSKLVVEIFNHHDKMAASSYSHSHKRYYKKIFFICKATGVYYLKYYYTGGTPTCGVSVLGVRNYSMDKKSKF